DLDYRVQARIRPVSLSDLSAEELESRFNEELFRITLLLVGTILMLARKDMSLEDEAFARTQDTRLQWLHDIVIAKSARTDEQNKYLQDYKHTHQFEGWLNFVCVVIHELE
ncbi:hypothetical protein GT037_004135, partial [Alternaria burnsii]